MIQQLFKKCFKSCAKNPKKKSIYLLIMTLIFFFANLTFVSAEPPPPPSSFYGTVKVNGIIADEGTIISAQIDGDEVASTMVQFFEGDSVYLLDILWIEGIEESPIVFYIDDIPADHHDAFWHSGTYTNLDLTAEMEEEGYKIFLPLILY